MSKKKEVSQKYLDEAKAAAAKSPGAAKAKIEAAKAEFDAMPADKQAEVEQSAHAVADKHAKKS